MKRTRRERAAAGDVKGYGNPVEVAVAVAVAILAYEASVLRCRFIL